MVTTTKSEPKSARDIAYYTQRYRNRVFAKLVSFVSDQLERKGMSKKDIAEILDRDPALITRWLSQPSNMNLDTVAMFALAFDAEAEPPDFVLFEERSAPNFVHPLIAKAAKIATKAPSFRAYSNASSPKEVEVMNWNEFRPKLVVSAI
jgi:transcriptional regulator with XRE-family HTH domain